LPCLGHEVHTIFFQGLIGRLRISARHALMPTHCRQRCQEAIACDAKLLQQPSRHSRRSFVNQGQRDMLNRDVLVFQTFGFVFSLDKQLLQTLGDVDFASFHARA
jgi:hypothetical protein